MKKYALPQDWSKEDKYSVYLLWGYGIFLFVFGHLLFKYRSLFADPPKLEYKTTTIIIDVCFIVLSYASIFFCEFFQSQPKMDDIPEIKKGKPGENVGPNEPLIGAENSAQLEEPLYKEVETHFEFTYSKENPITKKRASKEFHKNLLMNSGRSNNYQLLSKKKEENKLDFLSSLEDILSSKLSKEIINTIKNIYPYIFEFKSKIHFKIWLYLNMIDEKMGVLFGQLEDPPKETTTLNLTNINGNKSIIIDQNVSLTNDGVIQGSVVLPNEIKPEWDSDKYFKLTQSDWFLIEKLFVLKHPLMKIYFDNDKNDKYNHKSVYKFK